MEGAVPNDPGNFEKIFKDYSGRRTAIIRALTTDFQEFSKQCDPEKDNLCLYGFPNEQWEVKGPSEILPAELPEPLSGINCGRDVANKKVWLSVIAIHSDAWLLSLASYLGTRYGLEKADRERLFNMINDLPTITDVVKEQQEKKSAVPKDNYNTKSKFNSKLVKDSKGQTSKDEDEEEEEENYCGSCGVKYEEGEFWIGCDTCEKWYHGECVNMTSTKAKYVDQYECPFCSNKRAHT